MRNLIACLWKLLIQCCGLMKLKQLVSFFLQRFGVQRKYAGSVGIIYKYFKFMIGSKDSRVPLRKTRNKEQTVRLLNVHTAFVRQKKLTYRSLKFLFKERLPRRNWNVIAIFMCNSKLKSTILSIIYIAYLRNCCTSVSRIEFIRLNFMCDSHKTSTTSAANQMVHLENRCLQGPKLLVIRLN